MSSWPVFGSTRGNFLSDFAKDAYATATNRDTAVNDAGGGGWSSTSLFASNGSFAQNGSSSFPEPNGALLEAKSVFGHGFTNSTTSNLFKSAPESSNFFADSTSSNNLFSQPFGANPFPSTNSAPPLTGLSGFDGFSSTTAPAAQNPVNNLYNTGKRGTHAVQYEPTRVRQLNPGEGRPTHLDHHHIGFMPGYENKSADELRFEDLFEQQAVEALNRSAALDQSYSQIDQFKQRSLFGLPATNQPLSEAQPQPAFPTTPAFLPPPAFTPAAPSSFTNIFPDHNNNNNNNGGGQGAPFLESKYPTQPSPFNNNPFHTVEAAPFLESKYPTQSSLFSNNPFNTAVSQPSPVPLQPTQNFEVNPFCGYPTTNPFDHRGSNGAKHTNSNVSSNPIWSTVPPKSPPFAPTSTWSAFREQQLLEQRNHVAAENRHRQMQQQQHQHQQQQQPPPPPPAQRSQFLPPLPSFPKPLAEQTVILPDIKAIAPAEETSAPSRAFSAPSSRAATLLWSRRSTKIQGLTRQNLITPILFAPPDPPPRVTLSVETIFANPIPEVAASPNMVLLSPDQDIDKTGNTDETDPADLSSIELHANLLEALSDTDDLTPPPRPSSPTPPLSPTEEDKEGGPFLQQQPEQPEQPKDQPSSSVVMLERSKSPLSALIDLTGMHLTPVASRAATDDTTTNHPVSPASAGGNHMDYKHTINMVQRLPRLTNPLLVIEPSIKELQKQTNLLRKTDLRPADLRPADLRQVHNFTVTHLQFGSVQWMEPVDVTDLDLDATVVFGLGSFELQDSRVLPASSLSLADAPAKVSLWNCFPVDSDHKRLVAKQHALPQYRQLWSNYEAKLKNLCKRNKTQFVSYVPATGVWTFTTTNFYPPF